MICIIRIQSLEKPELLWDEIIAHKDMLQKAISNKGKLLYISKRRKYNEVSLFVHVTDPNFLGDFVALHLAKIPGVSGIWLINMMKPVFFPLPKDTAGMTRYTVTVKTYSPRLSEVYGGLLALRPPEGIILTYLAYTCHLFGDCIQFSLLTKDANVLEKYINEHINHIPGILRTTVCEIEKTSPFISWDEWQEYITRSSTLVEYDAQHMIDQFRK